MYNLFFVIFQPVNTNLPFWLKWLNKDIGHCLLLIPYTIGNKVYFIRSEICLYEIVTKIIPADALAGGLGKNEKSIKIWIKSGKQVKYSISLLDCVSFVKKQLGIYKPFVFTPRQLYKYLLKIGGEEHSYGQTIWW